MRGITASRKCFRSSVPTKERSSRVCSPLQTDKIAMNAFKFIAATFTVAIYVGCVEQSQISSQGQRFVLADEPAGAQGILDYRESKPVAGEVSLIGRVGLATLKWSNQSAMFVITDPSEALDPGQHVCNDENCPFCKAKAAGHPSRAIVMLIGDDGQVPAVPAKKLLPLEEGQTVVVSGHAEINEQGDLVVHAKRLYVRR
jgi:hypothetical protein